MAPAFEAELDAVVDQPLGLDAICQARRAEDIDDALLEDARAHARDHILLGAILEHDRLDALLVEKMGEQQPGRSGADDADLGSSHAYVRPPSRPSASTSCMTAFAMAKAEFAAGTPQ